MADEMDRLCPDGMVWIGDMSGFEVQYADTTGQLLLTHRCGWSKPLRDDFVYVGNLMEPLLQHREEGCQKSERSPEHAARVQRWQETSGRSPVLVDGPGCTPSSVPAAGAAGREAAMRVLRASGAIQDE